MKFARISHTLSVAFVLSLSPTVTAIPTPNVAETFIPDAITDGLSGLLNGVVDSVKGSVKYAGNSAGHLGDKINVPLGNIRKRDSADSSIPDAITTGVSGLLNGVKDSVGGTVKYVGAVVGRLPGQLLDPIGSIGKITKRDPELHTNTPPLLDYGSLANGKILRRSDNPPASGPKHLRPFLDKRTEDKPHPYNPETGKGATIIGGTNEAIDRQNPSNLTPPPTDAGTVVNLKWAFSDSRTKTLDGGWSRQQTVRDLPPSKDIAAAQQHVTRGSIRELHWHRVAEWAFVYAGNVLVSAVDEEGRNTVFEAVAGDIWYFPKGVAHTVQGLAEDSEYLLAFDDGDFDAVGTTFNLDDWIKHTPRDILARNFGIDPSVFDKTPQSPNIQKGKPSEGKVQSPFGKLEGRSSYHYPLSKLGGKKVAGGAGTLDVVDSRNFPISTTIASAVIRLEPGGLRELHWHPNADEWLFFAQGKARATIFLGTSIARTFDFSAGDTAVFPDNSGHYIENTGDEDLVWIEIYKSDRAVDISLQQWLALTPSDIVAQVLNIDESIVKGFKKDKQVLIKQDNGED
ncbi:Bicupin, oxalate decarboxylase/oxidase [Ascobolus immersus RN42]|uniref:Bicupin, oxalate decarboxylase/oxidase n=1 Tax=Ascobolus immersus RN42 TaxID=1160509 RepID=A0A3N4HLS2_ASCIM|nr:Bicupin, oxalate decarboxylase/oxidase [Ascobolus immersus RN42]